MWANWCPSRDGGHSHCQTKYRNAQHVEPSWRKNHCQHYILAAACNAIGPRRGVKLVLCITAGQPRCALSLRFQPCVCRRGPAWRVTRSGHFEIYAQSSDQRARAISGGSSSCAPFSSSRRLESRFIAAGPGDRFRFRAGISSPTVCDPPRMPITSALGSQDYIVMGTDDPAKFGLAAHEYAHLVLRAPAFQLPPWLKEGLAEFFATLHVTEHATELGGVLPGRLQHSPKRGPGCRSAELLSVSEESQKRLKSRRCGFVLCRKLGADRNVDAVAQVCSRVFRRFWRSPNLDVEAVTRDLHQWIDQPKLPVIQLPEVAAPPVRVQVSDVPPAGRAVLARAGSFGRGRVRSRRGAVPALPETAETSAALGAIALHKGDSGARAGPGNEPSIKASPTPSSVTNTRFSPIKRACPPTIFVRRSSARSRFSPISTMPTTNWRCSKRTPAIMKRRCERVPRHADGAGHARVSLTGWRWRTHSMNWAGATKLIPPPSTPANTPPPPAERARAAEQTYIAQTDPGVQFARDASGHLQLVTTRMPHQQSDWNPFIEPGDDIHASRATLREIDCGQPTTIRMEAAGKLVALAIPDLQHVQMRHAPSEFVCGPQPSGTRVMRRLRANAGGTTAGIVRGMDFSPSSINPAAAP